MEINSFRSRWSWPRVSVKGVIVSCWSTFGTCYVEYSLAEQFSLQSLLVLRVSLRRLKVLLLP